jgi:hypothetical protein
MSATRNLPLALPYHPGTFLERGVVVPFTTPLLFGTRARPAGPKRVDLLVPNPSGSRGVYVLHWSGVRELCRPTVHDARLNEKISALQSLSPAAIREAAREVAAEGLAGREAQDAAKTARDADQKQHALTFFLLVMALVEQVEVTRVGESAPDRDGVAGAQDRTKRAVALVAPRLGRKPEGMGSQFRDIALAFAPLGTGASATQARVARGIASLRSLHDDMRAWAGRYADEAGSLAGMIAEAAGLTLSLASRAVNDARTLLTNLPDLLRRWEAAPQTVAKLIERPDWLLDGWEQISLIWVSAKDEMARRAVLPEMASLVPVIPREALEWIGAPISGDPALGFRRTVPLNEDWRRGGELVDRVVRNERLRALAA